MKILRMIRKIMFTGNDGYNICSASELILSKLLNILKTLNETKS
jgi:hypothetical protein